MRTEVLRRVLSGRRRSLLVWAGSLVALVALIVFSFPAIRGQDSFAEIMEDYPEFVEQIMGLGGGLSITSAEGYLNSQIFANMLPLLFLVFIIGFAAKETAGEERDGTLDLLLAHPVTRTRVLLEKAAAMLGATLVLGLLSVLALAGFGPLVDIDIALPAYLGATLGSVAVAWVFGALAMAVGAALANRAAAIGISSGIAVVLYVMWGLAPLIASLEFTNTFNPWFWAMAGEPIVNGIQGANLFLLTGITAALLLVSLWGFRRRDLGV